MTQNIRLNKSEVSFAAQDNDTLLRAALRSNVALPYECNSGGCGSCKFELVEGEIKELWADAPGLSPRDIRKGKKLACQCVAVGDCEIKITPETNAASISTLPQKYSASYVGRRDLTADMAEFIFKIPTPAVFFSGQFAMLSLPNIGERAYSMSNIANEEGFLQFIIKRMPNGAGSNYLFDELQEGDQIGIDGPYGNSYLRTDNDRDIVCIGGGSGLSPVMSIVRSAVTNDSFKERNIHLFYGGRGPKDICTPELIAELQTVNVNIISHEATSDAELSKEHGWTGECCFIHELVEKKLAGKMPDYEYYFCGPPIMTNTVQRLLMVDNQVPFEQIHFDRFF